MRSWHSEQIEAEVPGLPAAIRKLVFESLEPVRRQRFVDAARIEQARCRELLRLQNEAKKAKKQAATLHEELAAATKMLKLEQAMKMMALE